MFRRPPGGCILQIPPDMRPGSVEMRLHDGAYRFVFMLNAYGFAFQFVQENLQVFKGQLKVGSVGGF